jgi:trk system potassium uptake protein
LFLFLTSFFFRFSRRENRVHNGSSNYKNGNYSLIVAFLLKRVPFWLSLLALLAMVYELGFEIENGIDRFLPVLYLMTLSTGIASIAGRYFIKTQFNKIKVWIVDALTLLFLVVLISGVLGFQPFEFMDVRPWIYFGILVVFVRELSALKSSAPDISNPARILIFSFLLMIAAGTILLLLPNATLDGISVVDALFTSTSAVCVTGLVVVDTGTHFTRFGQVIILGLIQLGGLGIMTFTSYFSYFFKGGSTYGDQLIMKEMTISETLEDVFGTLKVIILMTFLIEAAGAVFIYFSLDNQVIAPVGERIYFAVFHSVSGFCNAGFTTLSDSLYASDFRFNYNLHLFMAFLFIFGGLGFPIVFNSLKYIRHYIVNRLLRKKPLHVPWVVNINTRIILISTLVLLVGGTLFFYISEYNYTLAEHKGAGKVITAFFSAATPRSAGFNTVDTSALQLPTLMLVLLLMWIGASPGSTGGGIKTTTFAVALMNVVSVARGKDRIEVFRREISQFSVDRAFAIILLSFMVMGISVMLLMWIENDRDLLPVAFECFSAYNIVGLSMGITADLNDWSKIVIIANMFIGRVSMLTVLLALLTRAKHLNYRYPSESVMIN